ncbi:MAG: L-threonylcarbamoyladenylate synthase [Methylovulum sp.]|uniref:L-threonylcarbamoyladenylate synthase n=1 Tax=Methylovulum sp. TaxID=1916980 RepID=UPI0026090EF9|nr:L-threonylcarbamoyladenylate synthase [Methylovulum sp.]MDD2724241.1 L-threonylcarbamoyladenylate synthase [Methylovulum sp.]MDD5123026.1 L-threonylcarbamoyladenylate synthase [Methylovulum sp.]
MTPRPADAVAIHEAAQLLKQGRLVAFPTETVYGLGADASNAEAVRGIFAAKGRPADHPLIVHLADKSMLPDWAAEVPASAWQLAERFWPGPLAVILRKKVSVPLAVTGGQDTVALRVPNHPVALQLLQAFGGGIAAPSANRYCRISPTQAAHVAEELGDAVAMILDGGPCQVGVESTIIDLSGGQPRLLRPGQLSVAAIEAVLQQTLLLPEAVSEIRAPGMMAVHYAPVTMALLCPAQDLAKLAQTFLDGHQRVGVLAYQQDLPAHPLLVVEHMPDSVAAYAQALYASLRKLDGLQLDRILVEQPPQTEAWRAVNDRLGKAAVAV